MEVVNIEKEIDVVDELLAKAKKGDSRATDLLIEIISKDAKNKICRSNIFSIPGMDSEDIDQLIRIAIFRSIWQFDDKKLANFRCFSLLCVYRSILSTLNSSLKKQDALNISTSLEMPIYSQDDDQETTLYDTIADSIDLGTNISNRHDIERIDKLLMSQLTDLEKKVYIKYKEEKQYREIAIELGQTEKAIDNAMMRIRKKAQRIMDELTD